jgi:hypothetical protein
MRKKIADQDASISLLAFFRFEPKSGGKNPNWEEFMMSNSLMRTVILLTILALASGVSGFGQTISQTPVAGGIGGDAFQDSSIPSNARVVEVRIASGNYIDSVQLVYALPDGRRTTGTLRGGPGGTVNTFRLDNDEYVTGFSGHFGQYIDSLRIQTNRRTSPFYGGSGGREEFRIDVPQGNQAIGLIGRSGRYLDALGLIYTPLFLRVAGQTRIAGGSGGNGFMDNEIPLGARITEIRVQGGKVIDGIQVVYQLPDGSTFEGPYHGGRGGNSNVFRLEADEFVTGLSGRFGEYLDSLKIQTNLRTSPQYGGPGGRQDYRIDVPAGNQAVALIGRSGRYLDAIGLSYASAGRSSRGFFKRRSER